MNVQFTENKLIELYVAIDDLLQSYRLYQKSKGLGKQKHKRQTALNASEVATIMVAYHHSAYKCFEYYYRQLIRERYFTYFPDAPTYEGFLNYIPKVVDVLYLWMLYTTSTAKRTGLYFIDSKKLPVCHLKRERSHKVFKDIAAKGKTSTGWFYGLKIHLTISNLGDIMAFNITPENVADNNKDLLKKMLGHLTGICVGDKGYLSSLRGVFLEQGLHLMTKPRKDRKPLPVSVHFNSLISKRAVIESVFDILSPICDIVHTRHRKPINAFAHTLGALIAYQYLNQKPRVFYPSTQKNIEKAA